VRGVRAGVVVALLVGIAAPPARAYVPEKTPTRQAEAAARAMLGRRPAQGTQAGVVVMRAGRVLWARNASTSMIPASLMKLATTTTALLRFGPDHRFPTRVLGAVHGAGAEAVYLVGGGDPTFSTEAYRRKRYLPKPDDDIKRPAFRGGSPTVEQLAARVAAAGVRVVTGDVVADEGLFDQRRTQDGWLASYLRDDPDVSLLTALSINEGRAGADRDIIVRTPALAAGRALRDALGARGIVVAGEVRVGRAPAGLPEIARVSSPPLHEIVDFTNRYSVNFPAELLLKSLGARFGGAGTTEAGARVVRETLAAQDVPVDGFEMRDGSGLSLLDRMTPLTIATLLQRIVDGDGPAWRAVRSSLPVAGGPGTLLRRMTGPPTGGNLRGKTGQVRRVRGMAGWVDATDGRTLVYVALFNEAPSPFSLTSPLDLFGTLLALFPSL